jgi:hypothetical protein
MPQGRASFQAHGPRQARFAAVAVGRSDNLALILGVSPRRCSIAATLSGEQQLLAIAVH